VPVAIAVELQPNQWVEIPAGTQTIGVTNPFDERGGLQVSAQNTERRIEVPAHTPNRSVDLHVGGAQATVTNVGHIPIGVAY